jgi:hypothetical protein
MISSIFKVPDTSTFVGEIKDFPPNFNTTICSEIKKTQKNFTRPR